MADVKHTHGCCAAFVRNLLWDEHPECCGCPVVGATYMGDQEQVCCGQPEPALLNDKQIAATLRAKFPALPALKTQGWMPIETAPKDGSYFLAFNGHWRGVARYFEPNYEGDPVWTDEMTKYITPPPTHWMPLPAAPCLDAAIAKATGAARATEGSAT